MGSTVHLNCSLGGINCHFEILAGAFPLHFQLQCLPHIHITVRFLFAHRPLCLSFLIWPPPLTYSFHIHYIPITPTSMPIFFFSNIHLPTCSPSHSIFNPHTHHAHLSTPRTIHTHFPIPIKPIPPTFAWPHEPLQTFLPFHSIPHILIPITMPIFSHLMPTIPITVHAHHPYLHLLQPPH